MGCGVPHLCGPSCTSPFPQPLVHTSESMGREGGRAGGRSAEHADPHASKNRAVTLTLLYQRPEKDSESSERRSTFLADESRKIPCRNQGLRGNEEESFFICFLLSRGQAYWVLQALRTHPYLYVRIREARCCGGSRRERYWHHWVVVCADTQGFLPGWTSGL